MGEAAFANDSHLAGDLERRFYRAMQPLATASSGLLRHCLLPVLFAVGLLVPLRGQLVSVEDVRMPQGASYVIGIELRSSDLLLTTVAEIYSGVTAGSSLGIFNKILVASDFVDNLDPSSTVILDPVDLGNGLLYSSIVAFEPATTSLTILSPHATTVYPFPSLTATNGAIASDSAGALYAYFNNGGGIQKFDYQNANTTSPLYTTATSGAGALTNPSYGLKVVNNVIYALDPGNEQVLRYDAGTGNYLGKFAVTGARTVSDIAVSDNGRLYLTNGNGGGTIYDAVTGATLGTFVAAADVNVGGASAYKGRDSIVLDETNGVFYAEDILTGVHVFSDPALLVAIPEPATVAAILGVLALGVAGARRTRARPAKE